MESELSYYAQHGPMTDPSNNADLFTELPNDIPSLCAIVQGLLIHPLEVALYGVTLTEEQLHDQILRSVAARLARIRAIDPQPLAIARPAEQRLASQCYGFATLLCAMLRHQNIPARIHSGFARYFSTPVLTYNHWICEYWLEAEQRWVFVDPQLDPIQLKAHKFTFDPHDLPCSLFLTAAEVWLACRQHKLEPHQYGFDEIHGMGYIGCQLMLEIAALNKIELLATDRWSFMDQSVEEYSEEQNMLLDQTATLARAGTTGFVALRELYQNDAELRVPETLYG